MEITMISAVIVMAAYFLLLYGAVGFVQDKRFFGSAPKENLAAIPDKKERFPGAHTRSAGPSSQSHCYCLWGR